MINRKNIKAFEVIYTTAFKDDEEDTFLAISSHVEQEVENVVFQMFGEGHQIRCNCVMSKKKLYINIDDDIKIKAQMGCSYRMIGYTYFCFNMRVKRVVNIDNYSQNNK